MDVLNGARLALRLDEIVNAEGSGEYDENSACEVRERTVDGKTYTYADGCDERGKPRGVDADLADKTDRNDYLKTKPKYISKSLHYGLIVLILVALLLYFPCNSVNDLEGYEENYQRDENLDARIGSPTYDRIPNAVQSFCECALSSSFK